MKAGFIGAGSMGSLLTGSFLRAGAFSPSDLTVATRTRSKAEALAERYPGLVVAPANILAAQDQELIFLCVKPLDYRSVLDDIRPALRPEQTIISITSPVTIAQLEAIVPCKVAKVIPSIVNEACLGASLFMFGSRLAAADREALMRLFSAISRPVEIPEQEVRAASDLSSCGPAFMACLLEQFIDAAASTGMDRQLATTLACEMLFGTAHILQSGFCSPEQLQKRVSVPGGITAAALEELRRATDGAFLRVLQTTHEKFAEDLRKVERSLRP
ncbi:late competence protein ComER [Cohnella lubricantis]|uniref:Pyrroline-5-carboxylate reductase n=1 Tax=Cohnella lubricantis TaxID=2163172 RepID=A0A841T9R0_9BACL|nr:late competence protein ComER [Cohnella lubricantis]MBB6675777.1 late competence protein ComER [Cohnella lubricantis]MBP2119852.1 competence protein ComER [Cohnella lubricantis]